MNELKLLNAFSLNMVSESKGSLLFREISLDEARGLLDGGFESAVGHSDTAAVMASQLGVTVPAIRATIALKKGDSAIVGQYKGPRLPEGASTLPEGASIVWYLIEVA
ncbi:MAG TPA: DUF1874 domain-containing protein [Candidatus Paceibacterota bacterium]|jgi:hypothetical protein|nr:DUF1874 domain-containing protein [Candidatus Paceibacterota bacterium]